MDEFIHLANNLRANCGGTGGSAVTIDAVDCIQASIEYVVGAAEELAHRCDHDVFLLYVLVGWIDKHARKINVMPADDIINNYSALYDACCRIYAGVSGNVSGNSTLSRGTLVRLIATMYVRLVSAMSYVPPAEGVRDNSTAELNRFAADVAANAAKRAKKNAALPSPPFIEMCPYIFNGSACGENRNFILNKCVQMYLNSAFTDASVGDLLEMFDANEIVFPPATTALITDRLKVYITDAARDLLSAGGTCDAIEDALRLTSCLVLENGRSGAEYTTPVVNLLTSLLTDESFMWVMCHPNVERRPAAKYIGMITTHTHRDNQCSAELCRPYLKLLAVMIDAFASFDDVAWLIRGSPDDIHDDVSKLFADRLSSCAPNHVPNHDELLTADNVNILNGDIYPDECPANMPIDSPWSIIFELRAVNPTYFKDPTDSHHQFIEKWFDVNLPHLIASECDNANVVANAVATGNTNACVNTGLFDAIYTSHLFSTFSKEVRFQRVRYFCIGAMTRSILVNHNISLSPIIVLVPQLTVDEKAALAAELEQHPACVQYDVLTVNSRFVVRQIMGLFQPAVTLADVAAMVGRLTPDDEALAYDIIFICRKLMTANRLCYRIGHIISADSNDVVNDVSSDAIIISRALSHICTTVHSFDHASVCVSDLFAIVNHGHPIITAAAEELIYKIYADPHDPLILNELITGYIEDKTMLTKIYCLFIDSLYRNEDALPSIIRSLSLYRGVILSYIKKHCVDVELYIFKLDYILKYR